MKFKTSIIFLAFLLVFVRQTSGQQLDEARILFYRANAYYSEEKFMQAIADYEAVLKLGFESGPLYYNLGNAYFKEGSLGKAVLNYLRAKRLQAQDADLQSNLDYARSFIKGGRIVPQKKAAARIFSGLVKSVSLNEITLFSSGLYFILAVLIILIITTKKFKKILIYGSGVVLTILIVGVSVFFAQFYAIVIQKEAVVIAESVEAKFEPFDNATTFFTLYEGESAVIFTSKEDWVKARRSDGKQGWIKAKDIEFLTPM